MEQTLLFDKVLAFYGLTKKDFATKTKIPYDTVAGWKRAKKIPLYAFVLLKKIVFDEGIEPQKSNPPWFKTGIKNPDELLLKKVGVAFWGKDINVEDAIKRAKKGNGDYLGAILNNVYYKDAITLLGADAILKNIDKCAKNLPHNKIDFYKNVCLQLQ